MARTTTGVYTKDVSTTYSELLARRAQPILRPVDDVYLSKSPRGIKQREGRWVKREIRRKEAVEGGGISASAATGSGKPWTWSDADFPQLSQR
ncbi:hypothetical protein PG996_004120 [Apiospora saccharicola]|uniref:Uncharacterized protein n=1 Tax=Apiospora saccharicola TaxID=335842 RepID=A0ABR1W384_9PEZI